MTKANSVIYLIGSSKDQRNIRMMRLTLISLMVGCYSLMSAQDNSAYTKLDSCMAIYVEAIKTSDIDILTKLTHPNVVKMGGGYDYAYSAHLEDKQMYNQMQLRLSTMFTKGESKIIEAGEELHALVPYVKEFVKLDGSSYNEENFYLAASQDQGMSWTFVDMKKYDSESIKFFVPNYNGRLDVFLTLKSN